MKRLLTLLSIVTLMMSLTSCAGVKDIKLTSFAVKSVSLSGLKSVNGVLALGIENPIMGFTISDLKGVVNRKGEEFATFSAGKLPVSRKSSKVYPLSCSGSIAKNVGLLDLMKLAGSKDFSDLTVDISVKIKLRCGIGKTLRFKEMKVSELMEPEVAAACLELILDELG